MKTITETNKIIAEFMGLELEETLTGEMVYARETEDFSKINNIRTEFYYPEELLYHKSYDWLMPVYNKIEQLPLVYAMNTRLNNLDDDNYQVSIVPFNMDTFDSMFHSSSSKINAMYKAVVEFCEWFNNSNYNKK
jgi:hypothetical protein